MSTFRIVVLGIFIFFGVFGVLVFSGFIPFFNDTSDGVGGEVVLWGTLPAEYFADPLSEFNLEHKGIFTVVYIEKSENSFDRELVEALASRRGPDMILLPHDLIVRHADKVFPIPYESLSIRDFKDLFIEQGELYLGSQGSLVFPFSVDPLILYWNRDIFTAGSLSRPPKLWDELLTLAPVLTQKDKAFNIERSTIAFGEFSNITHAKDILSLLILQSGNPITERGEAGIDVVLSDSRGLIVPPVESALRFYTGFSNPVKPIYSWNKSLPQSKDFFLSNDLAVYIGYASEYEDIKRKSPNLNFDIALVPQSRDSNRKSTYGKMTGIAILKNSQNIQTAFHASILLTGMNFADSFSKNSKLPPVRRDLLAQRTSGSLGEVFYQSALMSRGWFDPEPTQSAFIFQTMIEGVTSGRTRISEAVTRAHGELKNLMGN